MSFFKLHGMGSGKPAHFAVRKSGPKSTAAKPAPTRAGHLPTHSLADIDETQFTKF